MIFIFFVLYVIFLKTIHMKCFIFSVILQKWSEMCQAEVGKVFLFLILLVEAGFCTKIIKRRQWDNTPKSKVKDSVKMSAETRIEL